MDLVVKTFSPNEDNENVKEFERFREIFLSGATQAERALYSADELRVDQQAAISLAYAFGAPYAASTLFRRDTFPLESIRCVNRFFVLQGFRVGGAEHQKLKATGMGSPRLPTVSVEMAKQQIEVAKRLECEFTFISREALNLGWCKKMTEQLVNLESKSWYLNPSLVAVCNPANKSCWQHAIVRPLNEKNAVLKFENTMEISEFKNKF